MASRERWRGEGGGEQVKGLIVYSMERAWESCDEEKREKNRAYVEADGCLRLSLRGKLEGGVTLRGEAGVLPPGALMKCVKISVCFRRKSNLLTLSCT